MDPVKPPVPAEDQGMLVPRRAVSGRVFLISGDGVPMKIAFGSRATDEEILLHLANDRRVDGPYLHAEEIVAGMVALDRKPHQRGDQSITDGGLTIRTGQDKGGDGPGERKEATATDEVTLTYPWLIVREDGTRQVLVLPDPADSFDVADALRQRVDGRFSIQAIQGGQMTVAPDPLVPGWSLVVKPTAAPEPCGPRGMH